MKPTFVDNIEKRVAMLPALFLLLIVAFSSCLKDDLKNVGFLPNDDLNQYVVVDTLTFTAKTVRKPAVESTNFLISPLGSYLDPVFGKTSASIATTLSLTVIDPSLGGYYDIEIDSTNLYLSVEDKYGENEEQEISVHLITEQIEDSTVYESDQEFTFNPFELGKVTLAKFNYLDSISIQGEKYAPGIKIPLYKAAGNLLFKDPYQFKNLTSHSEYRNRINGILIKSDPNNLTGNGGIGNVVLSGNSSFIRVYYTKKSSGESLFYDFRFTGGGATHVGLFNTDYSGTDVESFIEDENKSADFMYLQSMGGCYIEFSVNNIASLVAENKVILHKAELFLPSENDIDQPFAPHEELSIAILNQNNEERFTLDGLEGSAHFGGQYDRGANEFRFNLTRTFQNILNEIADGKKDTIAKFNIIPSDFNAGYEAASPNRTIIAGTNNALLDRQFKIIFSYTPLKQ